MLQYLHHYTYLVKQLIDLVKQLIDLVKQLIETIIEKCQLPRLVQSVSGVRMEKSRPLKPTELATQI